MVDHPRGACRSALSWTLAALLAGTGSAALSAEPGAGPAIDFARDVRPILSAKCFTCHGPDPKERQAKLRLDTPEGTFGPAASGARPVVPGKLDDSELYQRITSEDPEDRMPPAKGGKDLSAGEVAKLKAWVEQGASYQRHWAFVPPVKADPPKVGDPSWGKSPLDRFILARALSTVRKLR